MKKTLDKYDDEDETKTHEEDHYIISVVRDPSDLPEVFSAEEIPEMPDANASLDLHYSSKMQLSSPTTLEFSCSIVQGEYNFSLAGKVKTASQWLFAPFDITNAISAVDYSRDEFMKLRNQWIDAAEKDLDRTPEEIKLTESAVTSGPEEITETTGDKETTADPEEIPAEGEAPAENVENDSV